METRTLFSHDVVLMKDVSNQHPALRIYKFEAKDYFAFWVLEGYWIAQITISSHENLAIYVNYTASQGCLAVLATFTISDLNLNKRINSRVG